MRYLCQGYLDESTWSAMSLLDRAAFVRECLAYGQTLRAGGHWDCGVAASANAMVLRWEQGKVTAVAATKLDPIRAPWRETAMLNAQDLNHAICLLSAHPCLRRGGRLEVWPAEEVPSSAAAVPKLPSHPRFAPRGAFQPPESEP